MEASSATKDSSDGSDQPGASGLNWRQRKKANMRRQQEIQRRRELIDAYVTAAGGSARTNPIVMTDIERAVDLVMLAREMRASVRQGAAKISDLTRLEGAADRAVRRLNLPPPGAAPVQTLQDYLANRQAAADDEAEG
jgi:hypothetical protein